MVLTHTHTKWYTGSLSGLWGPAISEGPRQSGGSDWEGFHPRYTPCLWIKFTWSARTFLSRCLCFLMMTGVCLKLLWNLACYGSNWHRFLWAPGLPEVAGYSGKSESWHSFSAERICRLWVNRMGLHTIFARALEVKVNWAVDYIYITLVFKGVLEGSSVHVCYCIVWKQEI